MSADEDRKWMRRALRLASKGLGSASPNPMVGAVIVKDGKPLGEGWHVRPGGPHAEINAFASAQGKDIQGATLYVTLEPCCSWGRTPPCTDAILKSGVGRVVVGCLDPNPKHAGAGIDILGKAGLETVCGVERDACERLNEAFFKWIVKRRPFVTLKLASALDGKIATASGSSQWITGAKARAEVHRLRLWADAILIGAGTFRADNPSLTARGSMGNVLKTPRRFVASRNPASLKGLLKEGWEAVSLDSHAAWDAFLSRLGEESVTALLIEGGGELAASALRAGAIDKVEFHFAPKILGGRGSRPSVGGDNPASLAEALELSGVSIKKLGCDFAVSGYIKRKS